MPDPNNAETALDPFSRPMVEPRDFADLRLGERFILPSRTIADVHFAAFQTVSGDNHPIHYDVEYCRALGHPGLLAHGLHVLSMTAAGAGLFPHVVGRKLVGFLDVSATFLKPVYPGDTLYPVLEISGLEPQRSTGIVTLTVTIDNQRGVRVLEGVHRYLLKL